MTVDWIEKDVKMALINCKEARNSCIYMRFFSVAAFVLMGLQYRSCTLGRYSQNRHKSYKTTYGIEQGFTT
jgi:hypothetical protein